MLRRVKGETEFELGGELGGGEVGGGEVSGPLHHGGVRGVVGSDAQERFVEPDELSKLEPRVIVAFCVVVGTVPAVGVGGVGTGEVLVDQGQCWRRGR